MKQKGLAPLVIIILIALAVGGYLFYQKQLKPTAVPQPSPSLVASPVPTGTGETANPDLIGANWKIYTDSKYGFSLSYPKDWTLNNSSFSEDGKTVSFSSPYNEVSKDISWLHILISNKGYSNDFPDFEYNSEVGGIKSYKRSDPDSKMQSPSVTEQFKKGELYYQINFFYSNHSAPKVFNQILSTFKFLP